MPPEQRQSRLSNHTDSTTITQVWNPQNSATSSKRHTLSSLPRRPSAPHQPDNDGAADPAWRSRPGWEFLPPKSTPLAVTGRPRAEVPSPTTPNFSRPLGSAKHDGYFPDVSGRQDAGSGDQMARPINDSSGSSSRESNADSGNRNYAPTERPKSRKDRYSSKSLYSASSSGASSRAKTMTSVDSYTPLIPQPKRQDWATKVVAKHGAARPRYVPREEYVPPRPPLPTRVHSEPRVKQASPKPPELAREEEEEGWKEEHQEPTLDISAIDTDEHEALTALPAMSPARPESFASAAEAPTIKDNRLLDGKAQAQSQAQPQRDKPQSRTTMSSFPEVMRRPVDEQHESGRQWSASTFDTSSLSPEKIAKLKKKGINPALYLEMKSYRGERKKGRIKLPPLVGNTFL